MFPAPGVAAIWTVSLSDAPGDGSSASSSRPVAPSDESSASSSRQVAPSDESAWAILTADEHARAMRLRIESKRRQFIRCRAALRTLLGRALDVDPTAITFGVGMRGRPVLSAEFLARHDSARRLDFNVSHSDDWGTIALAAGAAIGIDVENQRGTRDLPSIARRYFSSAESEAIASAPDAAALARRFFQAWTAREAILKTTGHGLSGPLAEIELELDDERDARLLKTPAALGDIGQWRLESFAPATGYFATVAVRTDDPTAWRIETNAFAWRDG